MLDRPGGYLLQPSLRSIWASADAIRTAARRSFATCRAALAVAVRLNLAIIAELLADFSRLASARRRGVRAALGPPQRIMFPCRLVIIGKPRPFGTSRG
jgi:hypothetical protein